jgi:secondary thiamine-phosphate synthase enzyme
MNWYKDAIQIRTQGKGLYPFSPHIQEIVRQSGISEGMCYLYIQHTSASLAVSESYDPSAKIDLEAFMENLVPEGQNWFRHTLEGPDDSTSHIRAMLTLTSLSIPIDDHQLNLGTWQGVYLFEHRTRSHQRRILVRCLGID